MALVIENQLTSRPRLQNWSIGHESCGRELLTARLSSMLFEWGHVSVVGRNAFLAKTTIGRSAITVDGSEKGRRDLATVSCLMMHKWKVVVCLTGECQGGFYPVSSRSWSHLISNGDLSDSRLQKSHVACQSNYFTIVAGTQSLTDRRLFWAINQTRIKTSRLISVACHGAWPCAAADFLKKKELLINY